MTEEKPQNQIFSEEVENYPENFIQIFNLDPFFKYLFANRTSSSLDSREAENFVSEEFCDSISRRIRPRKGLNRNNVTELIINFANFTQEFLIEECT